MTILFDRARSQRRTSNPLFPSTLDLLAHVQKAHPARLSVFLWRTPLLTPIVRALLPSTKLYEVVGNPTFTTHLSFLLACSALC